MKEVKRYQGNNGNLYITKEEAQVADENKKLYDYISNKYGFYDFSLDKVVIMFNDKKLLEIANDKKH